jgi:hypothetical protein
VPRNQRTAAQRAREAQRATGGKYTALLRAASADKPKNFPFRSLLVECSTLPEIEVDWGYNDPWDDDFVGPVMFESALLGGPVPCGTVLALAGALSGLELRGEVHVESYRLLAAAVISCEGRRFNLVLNQDLLYELCRGADCDRHPIDEFFIPYCAGHLAKCPVEELIDMAQRWGQASRDAYEDRPGEAQSGTKGDHLVKVAVAQGAFEKVAAALVEYCFTDSDLIDDVHTDAAEAMAVRHGTDREGLRLTAVANKEGKRIRQSVNGSCVACGAPLICGFNVWSVPPQFCSTSCAPPRTCRWEPLPNPWVPKAGLTT